MTSATRQLDGVRLAETRTPAPTGLVESGYADLFDALPIPAARVDAAGCIVDLNGAFLDGVSRRVTEIRHEDCAGRHISHLATGERGARLGKLVDEMLAGRTPQRRLWTCEDAAGRLSWCELQAAPVIGPGGQVTGGVVLWHDITELRQRELQLRQAVQRIRERVWGMTGSGDVANVMEALATSLCELKIDYTNLTISVVEEDQDPPAVRIYNPGKRRWLEAGLHDGRDSILQIWRARQVAYRSDLDDEDAYGERHRVNRGAGNHIRSVLDVPFSRGTLGLSHTAAGAFSEDDIAALTELAQALSDGFSRLADLLALQEREERYRNLHESITDGVFLMDREWRYAMVNESGCQMIGRHEEELIGLRLTDVFPEFESTEFYAAYRKVARTGEPDTAAGEFVFPDGRRAWYEVRVYPAPEGILCIARDITEQRKAQESLVQSSRLIALGEMAAGMAHELNQPLTAISVLAEGFGIRLKRGMEVSRERQQQWGRQTLECVHRMRRVIEHLRMFSRDRSTEPSEEIDLDGVVGGALTMAATQLKSRGIELSLDLAGALPPVLGDRYRLEQVLLNLVSNARDALTEKQRDEGEGWKMRLAIGTRHRDGRVLMEVEDNGPGIAEAKQGRIFEPFYTTKTGSKGTGLGLSISHAIVREHGGLLECDSRPGRGSRFTVSLPAAPSRPCPRVAG